MKLYCAVISFVLASVLVVAAPASVHAQAPPMPDMSGYTMEAYATRSVEPNVGGGSPTIERKITKNATLELLVTRAEDAAEDMRLIAAQYGGLVETVQLSQVELLPPFPYEHQVVSPSPTRGYITIRVPAAQFDQAMRAVKAIALDVERESVTAQDVTEQFVDIEARLKNLRAEEVQYQEIMDRASTVEETLNVASRLYDVRGRIESTDAQLKYLSQQVEMSTITAALSVESNVEVLGIRWRPLVQAKESVHALLRDLSRYADFLIAFVIRLPILILWLLTAGIAFGFLWRLFVLLRRFVRKLR